MDDILRMKFSPARTLALGFLGMIISGTILLMLPVSSSGGIATPFVDALFTATSAVTTTGLTVFETGSYFSTFGQFVILLLMQIGGLGYMVFIALIVLGLGKKLTLTDRLLLHESIARPMSLDVRKFVKVVILLTLLLELAGALALAWFWSREYPWSEALYLGVFHSISAFCTAGFYLFEGGYQRWGVDGIFIFINAFLCVAGAIGFFVLYDLYHGVSRFWKKPTTPYQGLSVYSKFVLYVTMALIGGATLVIWAFGSWAPEAGHFQRFGYAFFQSMSASTTAGLTTMDIPALPAVGLLVIMILMLVGGASGGTGGGIKTTTFGTLALFLISFMKGEEDVQFFKRRIPAAVITKCFAIVMVCWAWLTLVTMALLVTEKAPFLWILFEVVSAMGTGGLSLGLTPELSDVGKLLIAFSMLVGRLGPLLIGFSIVGKVKPVHYRNATVEMLVG